MSILDNNIDKLDNVTCEWVVKIIGADSKIDRWLRQLTPTNGYWESQETIAIRIEKFILEILNNKPIVDITPKYIEQLLQTCVISQYRSGFKFVQSFKSSTSYYGIERRLTKYSPMVGIYVKPKNSNNEP